MAQRCNFLRIGKRCAQQAKPGECSQGRRSAHPNPIVSTRAGNAGDGRAMTIHARGAWAESRGAGIHIVTIKIFGERARVVRLQIRMGVLKPVIHDADHDPCPLSGRPDRPDVSSGRFGNTRLQMPLLPEERVGLPAGFNGEHRRDDEQGQRAPEDPAKGAGLKSTTEMARRHQRWAPLAHTSPNPKDAFLSKDASPSAGRLPESLGRPAHAVTFENGAASREGTRSAPRAAGATSRQAPPWPSDCPSPPQSRPALPGLREQA